MSNYVPAVRMGDELEFLCPVEMFDGTEHTRLIYAGQYDFMTPGGDWYPLYRWWRTELEWRIDGRISSDQAIQLADNDCPQRFRQWAADSHQHPWLGKMAASNTEKTLSELLEQIEHIETLTANNVAQTAQ